MSTPKAGQEWTGKTGTKTTVRIVEWPSGNMAGTVESLLTKGNWGRRRKIWIRTLQEKYALTKEAP
jgi:hypothetical protein